MKPLRIYSLAAVLILATGTPLLGQRLNPPPPLDDAVHGGQIGDGTRNLVICIHGWNPPGPLTPAKTDKYVQEDEWAYVVSQLETALTHNTPEPWSLLLYHWEEDANTGFIGFEGVALGQATQAAINARAHGDSLGPRLPKSLRRVHLIAHSAGAWCARQVAEWLIANRPYVVVQVTLLDPFIPEVLAPSGGLFSVNAMSQMAQWSGNDRIRLLENYYADDSIPGIPTLPTLGTQSEFNWQSKGSNLQVEWTLSIWPYRLPDGIDIHYDYHSGPIQFYADTTWFSLNPTASVPTGLFGPPYDAAQVGWFRSLFQAQFSMPRFITQPVTSQDVSAGKSVTLSVTTVRADTFQWFKDGQQIGATGSSYTFSASQSTTGEYVVRASGQYGLLFSDAAKVGLTSPPPPAAPSITSVSPSTLATSTSQQRIKIFGTSFTSSSTLLFNGSIASDPARLTFVNANEINYNIIVASAGNWTVKVINGSQESNLGTFTVTTPPPNTGSLTVDLSPSGAVSAGAQWRVDGGTYHNSGDTVAGLSPGLHTVSFTTVAGYTTPAAKSVSISSGVNTSDTSTYTVITPPNTGSLTVNLSPSGAVSAGAQWRVDGGSYRNNGDTATGLTPGPHTVSFKTVAGYTTPADKPVTITSGATTSDPPPTRLSSRPPTRSTSTAITAKSIATEQEHFPPAKLSASTPVTTPAGTLTTGAATLPNHHPD